MTATHTPPANLGSDTPLPVTLGILFAVLLTGAFYLAYAQNAWFLQDDFHLIAQYANALHLQEIVDAAGVGRFLTRNFYWYYGIKFFHLHAPLFFLLNLFFVCATGLLACRMVSSTHGRFAGLIAGLVYFCLPGTVDAYAWLANSQHLVCHFFVMLFLYLAVRDGFAAIGRARIQDIAVLMLVVMLGFWSNAFMGMAVTLPLWMLLVNAAWRRHRLNYVVPALGMALFIYVYIRLQVQQAGPYATSFSLGTLWLNAAYYYGGQGGAAAWVLVVLAGAGWSCWKRRFFTAWLLLASFAFFLPFAFLVHQRYGTYSVFSHFFFWAGLWCLVCDELGEWEPRLVQYVGTALLLLVLAQSLILPIRYFGEYPKGKTVREHVEQLRLFDAQNPAVKSYCFRSDNKSVNTSGVEVWDTPADWWFAGHGTAYSLFVNNQKTYTLASPTARCDVTFVFKDRRLELAAP